MYKQQQQQQQQQQRDEQMPPPLANVNVLRRTQVDSNSNPPPLGNPGLVRRTTQQQMRPDDSASPPALAPLSRSVGGGATTLNTSSQALPRPSSHLSSGPDNDVGQASPNLNSANNNNTSKSTSPVNNSPGSPGSSRKNSPPPLRPVSNNNNARGSMTNSSGSKKPALPPGRPGSVYNDLQVHDNGTMTLPKLRPVGLQKPASMTATTTNNAKQFLQNVIQEKDDNSSDDEDDSGSPTNSVTSSINPSMVASAGASSSTSSSSQTVAAANKPRDPAADMLQRTYIAQEILSTEKKYINNLNRIITIFMLPLRDKSTTKEKILSVDDINKIFMNIETIFSLHKAFITDFEKRIESWSDTQKIGDIFLKLAPYLRSYTLYSNQYNESILQLSSLQKANPAFQSFLAKCLLKPASKGLNLSSYLIMPIQRIPRYKLLLDTLLAKSPESHVDYADLKEALDKVGSIAQLLDERLLQFQVQHKVLDIQNNLLGFEQDIVKPSRVFCKEGDLKKISDRVVNTRHFFLFNDLLLYAIKEKKNQYRYKHSLPLEKCWVKDLPDTERFNYLFQIISPAKTYFLCAPTEEEKQSWMKMLNEVINKMVGHLEESQRSSVYERRGSMTPSQILASLEGGSPKPKDKDKEETDGSSDNRNKPMWLKDQIVKACMHCSSSFTVTRRRHHCRKCGKIFCNDCCPVTDLSQYLPGKKARICKKCFEEISVQLTEMMNIDGDIAVSSGSPAISSNLPTSLNSSFNSQCSMDDDQ
ncbi:hypothetical protein SAMD00019534_077770 [Acytostelium subglobosum LB1]|uniref:hypothetical protein n=1 Tax=Acytostelium subglobosum LB1 TaxID=1410327 RepID=UPI000644C94C|nr:hypothetical protein SAMD00019534_077770 [Acytostelium subglobosum LB1]GAM24602.1 hypothetical protein SAMD00019534_077770 [Acytostelium subglobosum LB1]|eukprot:XP_012752271.1 hypothetical protein SAMD00019534_077770 [Acytostelium subglobosum LB1]